MCRLAHNWLTTGSQLAQVELNAFSESIYAIEMSFSGFQDRLEFLNIVTDGYLFGNLGWATQVNNTEELLLTASAGANEITGDGAIFALELLVPDTLSSQYVPIFIYDFLGIPLSRKEITQPFPCFIPFVTQVMSEIRACFMSYFS